VHPRILILSVSYVVTVGLELLHATNCVLCLHGVSISNFTTLKQDAMCPSARIPTSKLEYPLAATSYGLVESSGSTCSGG
jgi:hypothetical protein